MVVTNEGTDWEESGLATPTKKLPDIDVKTEMLRTTFSSGHVK
jgi:hypothetical protein